MLLNAKDADGIFVYRHFPSWIKAGYFRRDWLVEMLLKMGAGLILLLLACSGFAQSPVYRSYSGVMLNNEHLTPGATRTEDVALVCYEHTRPIRNVTRTQRKEVFAEYGVPLRDSRLYELDHLIPLELGGANDSSNLWPQPRKVPGAREKDKLESFLHREVCSGRMELTSAQKLIANDWWAAYRWMMAGKKP